MSAEDERDQVRRSRAVRNLAESRVVAVRLDGHLANRLDDLCDRTGRKRPTT